MGTKLDQERGTSFWRDFLDGLAGPGAVPVPSYNAAMLIGAAHHDLIAKFVDATVGRHVAEDANAFALRIHNINHLFENMRRQVGAGDLSAARNSYREVEELAGPTTEASPPFERFGGVLFDSADVPSGRT
jgi:hypothetical protein